MAIIIAGKRYAGKWTLAALKEMFAVVKRLPQPTVVARDEATVNLEETILCLQREAVYINQHTQLNPIKYIGSKYVEQCIVVYIFSETDHFIVHVDQTLNLDFTQYIEPFKNKNNLTAMLIGGYSDDTSEDNVKHILFELYKTAETLNVDITISSQKLLQDNCFTHEDRYGFVYDTIIKKTQILSSQIFNKPLNIAYFNDCKVGDLKNKSANEHQSYDKSIFSYLTLLFSKAAEAYMLEEQNVINSLFNEIKNHFKSADNFLWFIANLFISIEGFELLSPWYERSMLAGAALSSFVISLQTKIVCRIGFYTETPREATRMAAIVDSDTKLPPKYFLYYDGHTDQYNIPLISQNFIQRCKAAKSTMVNNFFYDQAIFKVLGLKPDIFILNFIVKFINNLNEEKPQNISSRTTHFFKGIQNLNLLYCGIVSREKAAKLTKITGETFFELKRSFPESISDALCPCVTQNAADMLHLKLNQLGIFSQVFPVKQGWMVRVPAINIGCSAQIINDAYQNFLANALPVVTLNIKLNT